MNTEELGNVIEEWQNANWNYVTKEQCKKFRNEFEYERENKDIKAIIENIKNHMANHGWEYTPVSEEPKDTVTTEDVAEDTDSAGDSTPPTKPLKLTRKEKSFEKKQLRINEFANLSLADKCNADTDYTTIVNQIKKIKDNLDEYNKKVIKYKKKKNNKIATLEKKLEKIEDMIMLGKK